MFGIGVPELVIILVIGLVIFGPGKLVGCGKAMGDTVREFRNSIKTEEDNNSKQQNA